MGNFLEAMKHPEYIHVLLNPILVYVLPTGIALLAIALFRKNRDIQTAALWLLVFVGVMAWPTWFYGHQAFDHLAKSLSDEGKQWANVHAYRANRFVYSLYATGIVALAAIFLPRKFAKITKPLTWLALIFSIVAFATVSFVARPGGEIRHSEFRMGPPPHAPEHKHEHEGDAH